MKFSSKILIVLYLLLGYSLTMFSQVADKSPFDTKMFAVVPLDRFGTDEETFKLLSENDKQDLFSARSVLMNCLRQIEHKQNALASLSPDLAKQYKTSTECAASVVAPETLMIATGITEFKFLDQKSAIQLRYWVLTCSEGTIETSEKSVALKRFPKEWKIIRFE